MKWLQNTMWIALLALPGLAGAQIGDVSRAAGVQNDFLFSTNLAWGDYDGDGDFDLYVTNWGTGAGAAPFNALFRNEGNGRFVDKADSLNIRGPGDGGNSTAAAWADYDNDGDLDLYVVDFTVQDFLHENRDGIFENVADHRELALNQIKEGSETDMAWGDYDNDGYLDIYLGKYYHHNQLYHNSGDGTFERVTNFSVLNDKRDANDVTWVDYDNDGDLDIFVVNREQENALYRNDPGPDTTFTEVFCALSLDNMEIGQKSAWADYDNDGDLDVYLGNAGANALYRNMGSDTFVDVAGEAGVRHSGPSWLTADVAWADYDGDGDPDLYLASGADDAPFGQPDVLFENNGDNTFDNSSSGLPITTFNFGGEIYHRFHMAAGWGDYNGNGVPDLYVADGGGFGNQLFENASADSTRFIRVRVRGSGPDIDNGSNLDGIGAQVKLFDAAGLLQGFQQVLSGPGAPELFFGTPEAGAEYDVEIYFPRTNTTIVRRNIPGGSIVEVEEVE